MMWFWRPGPPGTWRRLVHIAAHDLPPSSPQPALAFAILLQHPASFLSLLVDTSFNSCLREKHQANATGAASPSPTYSLLGLALLHLPSSSPPSSCVRGIPPPCFSLPLLWIYSPALLSCISGNSQLWHLQTLILCDPFPLSIEASLTLPRLCLMSLSPIALRPLLFAIAKLLQRVDYEYCLRCLICLYSSAYSSLVSTLSLPDVVFTTAYLWKWRTVFCPYLGWLLGSISPVCCSLPEMFFSLSFCDSLSHFSKIVSSALAGKSVG